MTMRTILLLIAVLAAGGAWAEDAAKPPPLDVSKYPADVQKALRTASGECRAQGGGEAIFASTTVTALDLTGDGRDDYILQFGDTQCSAGARAVILRQRWLPDVYLVTLPNGK